MLRILPALAAFLLLAAAGAPASATKSAPAKYKVNLPPSADLEYAIKANESGLALSGDGLVQWRAGKGVFSVSTETKAAIVGKIHASRSEGIIDAYGLAPLLFTEKRFRKQPLSVTFDRNAKTIRFSQSDQTYPIQGGEQDRTSAIWQLVGIARAAQAKFQPGSNWTFFVAGRTDGEPWTFRVMKQETVRTPLGNIQALHVTRLPPADAKDRRIDIWLAPSLEWYPVRIRYSDADTDAIEQTLRSIHNQ